MRVRYTEKSFENARAAALDKREKIQLLDTWLSHFNLDFWKGVVERINERIEELRLDREVNLDKMPEAMLRANIACERELKGLLRLPERARQMLETLKVGYKETMEFIDANRDKAG